MMHLRIMASALLLTTLSTGSFAAEYHAGGTRGVEYREGADVSADRGATNNYYIYADSYNRDRTEDRIENRQDRQDDRIRQGVQSGELTRKEANKLDRKDDKLDRRIDRMEDSGSGINRREAEKIERMQDRQSDRIYREKHDRQDRR